MGAAIRNDEFVADFAAERSQLREPEMVRIAGLPSADEAWLLQGDEVAVSFVAIAARFRYLPPSGPPPQAKLAPIGLTTATTSSPTEPKPAT